MKKKSTHCTFVDAGGRACELGIASTAKPQIWFGIIDHPRMLLDKKQVKALLPMLTKFVDKGKI